MKPHPRDVAAYTEAAITIAPDSALPPAVHPAAAAAREMSQRAAEAEVARHAAESAHKAAQDAYKARTEAAAASGGPMPSTDELTATSKALEEAAERAAACCRVRGEALGQYVADLKQHRDEHVAGIPARVAQHVARMFALADELEAEAEAGLYGTEVGLARWLHLVGRTPRLSSWKAYGTEEVAMVQQFAAALRGSIELGLKQVAGPDAVAAMTVDREHRTNPHPPKTAADHY